MDEDTQGLVIGLTGTLCLVVGLLLLASPTSAVLDRLFAPVPSIEFVAPTLTYGGFALLQVGRHVALRSGDGESRYYGPRRGRLGRLLTNDPLETTTATSRWHTVLLAATGVQLAWAVLRFGGGVTTTQTGVLRYGSAFVMGVAGHYAIEHVGAQAGWDQRRLWEVGLVVFPVNLLVVALYLRVRRRKVGELGDDWTDDHVLAVEEDAPSGAATDGTLGLGLVYASLFAWAGGLVVRFTSVVPGGVADALVVGALVLTPLSVYVDTRNVSGSFWRPKRVLWVVGAAIPVVGIAVILLYLLRRYEIKLAVESSRNAGSP